LTRDLHHKVEERMRRGYLEEQLAVIQGELGLEDPVETEAARLEERVAQSRLGPAYRERVTTELFRFRRAPSGSPEASRLRAWIEWVLELPWGIASPDPEELDGGFTRVTRAIDRTHTGLKDVKNRVCEFLAVRHLGGTAHGTVLCFSGPPGTGKTSMASAVAQALGRELVHIQLGDINGEDSLRGRHSTQPDAVPGMLLQGILRAGTLNPVVLIDDIDRLSEKSDEAAGVLLQILDRELNRAFVDHYLGVPFDLSQCIFLVTAGDEERVPDALLDRLEVIRFGSYTEAEKLAIAREHLIPQARANAGLDHYQFRVTPGALRSIVRDHTHEAGVRQLERALSSLARKAAVQVLRGNYGLLVRKTFLPDLLGPGYVDEGLHPSQPRVGVAMGLAWTSAGGALLPIEAVRMPGGGNTILTGSVGDVMRESVQAAISHVRTRFAELGIAANALDALDVHLHFPSGAVPKDGPSAGMAIATAMVSLLTGTPVCHDVAMTGELSLHGAVLPIGGLREKLLAAIRGGIGRVVVPARNSEEVLRLPAEVRQQLEIHLVDDIAQCLEVALVSSERSRRGGRRARGPRRAAPGQPPYRRTE
jgi:ATP-dependent Lon protease